jgi:nucleotide-binding universal stress UspA family protein
MFNTVVVGADDSSTARQAVVVAADIAQLTGGTLHIVTAYQRQSVRAQDLPEEFRHTATLNPADALLHQLSLIAKERGLHSMIHPALGQPAESVIRVAEQENADLIVVGNPRGRLNQLETIYVWHLAHTARPQVTAPQRLCVGIGW